MPHLDVVSGTGSLFDVDVPTGFLYLPDVITADEEAALASEIARIEFENFELRGVTARRRVKVFGQSYDGDRTAAPPLPEFLLPLRDNVARWANVDPRAFAMALINEYTPGTPIGWHRDAPQYDIVAGISLLSSCRMKFRPYPRPGAPTSTPKRRRPATHEVLLERRSGYVLADEARSAYEHHIPAVTELRYSITFRTLRG